MSMKFGKVKSHHFHILIMVSALFFENAAVAKEDGKGSSKKKGEKISFSIQPFISTSSANFSIQSNDKDKQTQSSSGSETTSSTGSDTSTSTDPVLQDPYYGHLKSLDYTGGSVTQRGIKFSLFGLNYSMASNADQKENLSNSCGKSVTESKISYYGRPISIEGSYQDFRNKPDVLCPPYTKTYYNESLPTAEAIRYIDNQDIHVKAISGNMFISLLHTESTDDMSAFEGGLIPLNGGGSILMKVSYNRWSLINENNTPFVPPNEAEFYGDDYNISKVTLTSYGAAIGFSAAGMWSPFSMLVGGENHSYSAIALLFGNQWQNQEFWRSDYDGNPIVGEKNKRYGKKGSLNQFNLTLGYYRWFMNIGVNYISDGFSAALSSYEISASRNKFEFFWGLAI